MATIGAHRPAILLKNEAIPVPVPRFGAGKVSVHASAEIGGTGGVHERLTRSISVQHAVHDVLEKGHQAAECELEIRIGRDGEEENENAGQEGRNCHGTFSANILDVNSVAG